MRTLTCLAVTYCLCVTGIIDASSLGRRQRRSLFSHSAVIGVSTKTAVPLHHRFLGSPSKNNNDQGIETRVSELWQAFEPTMTKRGLVNDIDNSRLLRALKVFERAMRRVGETNSARDLNNNIQKFERVYHEAPVSRRRTMVDLLEYEKSLGIHPQASEPNNNRLKDPSGAMGLLWIRRSLAFQHKMYSQILLNDKWGTGNEVSVRAGMAAYHSELEPFHGWALKRIYTYAIQRNTPPPREILARIGGFDMQDFGEAQESATRQELMKLLDIWKPLISTWKRNFDELGLDDTRQV